MEQIQNSKINMQESFAETRRLRDREKALETELASIRCSIEIADERLRNSRRALSELIFNASDEVKEQCRSAHATAPSGQSKKEHD